MTGTFVIIERFIINPIMRLLYFFLLLTSFSFADVAPTAQFTGSPLTVCLGSPVNFTNQSTNGTAPINAWAWDFGDGNSATTTNAAHIYTAPGTYTVTLTVTASNGQADAEVKVNYVVVNPKPNAAFTASTNGCALPVGVTFNNTSSAATSYAWNFGNTQTSTLQNPAVVNYPTAGTFNVSLIITNNFGCKDTATQALVVSNYQAGITAPTTACVGAAVSVNDNSTVGANAWNWTFGGGAPGSSTSQNNTVVFNAPGTYTISLSSQNTTSGCSANTTKQITILPLPIPAFTANPTSGCAPQAVTFTNTSPAGTNFIWTFGDGTTFTGQTPPPHTYANNGTYNVSLTMTGANGCIGAISQNALITLNAPLASFTSDVTGGCAPLDVQFTSTATSTDPIVSWVWNFGDGQTFNGQNPPEHTYQIGVYDVILTITTQSGCVGSDTIAEYIEVGKVDLVDFSIDETPECAKTNIDFTNLSVINAPHDDADVTYDWDFGDGGTSTAEDPGYSYPNDTGYFDVQLIVTWQGCKDTLKMIDAVYIKPPISRFQPAQTLYCNMPLPVNVVVNDQSIINSINPAQDSDVTWRWGDGTASTFMDDPLIDDADKSTTSHNYTQYGSYTIKQVIFNHTTGCSDSTTATVHISNASASFTVSNDSVCEGSPMSMNATASTTAAAHNPFTYAWSMGNGETTTGQNPTYTYPNSGTFTITLTATNSVGCFATSTFAPMRALETPLAQISAVDNAGCAPFVVTFTNGSSPQGNGVPLASFLFSFPDNNTTQTTNSTATNVNHTFNTEGIFPVTLVATDQFGCVSSPATTSITITKPVAVFTVDSVVCNNEVYTTANTSTGSVPLTYQWFVDGTQESTSMNYSSFFEEIPNGTASTPHILSVIVTDVNGCKDTITAPITVSTPVAILDYTLDGAATNANGDFTCPPVFAVFTDESLSLGDVVSYQWVFGDGKSSTLENPNNTYVFPGTYSAGMAIVDEFGCTSDTTLIDFLTIFGPTATPSWSQDPAGCGQDITFDIGTTSFVTEIVWTLDDGNIVNDSTLFTHTYQNVATYNPTVTIYDSNNCEVIYPLDPVVIPDNGINAFFTASQTTDINLGSAVYFVDGSTSGTPLVSWTWDLGVAPPFSNSTGNTVSYTYVTPGDILVTLTVEDALGCFDQYQVTIHVDGNFSMPNVITPNGDGTNDNFSFYINIFESFDITILNRWGNIVQEKTNQTGTLFWDGTNNGGEVVSDGVYFYLLRATLLDGTEVTKDGFVQVFKN